MQVVQNLESISINTQDFLFFKEMKEIINKNFSQNIGKKSKLISFYVENEIPQRRYFLKLLSILNKKYNNEQLQNINTAYYKKFKLNLVSVNSLKAMINCKLDFMRKDIILNFSNLEKNLIIYLSNYFKEHDIKILKTKFIITYKDENTLSLLDKLCACNEHLNYCVSFSLSELAYLQFKKEIKNELKKDNRFLNVCMLLEEHFKTLGVEVGASFDVVRNKYLKLSKVYHPDFHSEKSEEVKRVLKEKFEEINIAYESLKPLYKNVS
ncbi:MULTISPECIES: adenylosuccinate lyase [unclassified Campylobacter]|uniref:adenylosuccinate lyase n=1 Tax=unclassified Campylobacter TaxID=2593542 RepID=UPI001DB390FB|nr:adenylosuccinate lyase [Campylobacter sp. RM9331]MBZ8005402.1 adenylosuccinate lyase [Campylobacter sp. RM9332]